MTDHMQKLLDERSTLLRRKFSASSSVGLDEVETVRLLAINYELDIIEFDSPAGQSLDARYRELMAKRNSWPTTE